MVPDGRRERGVELTMSELTRSVTELIDEFAKMPGIGKKTAERLAYYV